MRNLIIYSTTDGQTIAISKKIGEILGDSKVISIKDAGAEDLNEFETVVIGASIRYGKHKPEVFRFIQEIHKILDIKKNDFFS